jgi:hypothetical protein
MLSCCGKGEGHFFVRAERVSKDNGTRADRDRMREDRVCGSERILKCRERKAECRLHRTLRIACNEYLHSHWTVLVSPPCLRLLVRLSPVTVFRHHSMKAAFAFLPKISENS